MHLKEEIVKRGEDRSEHKAALVLQQLSCHKNVEKINEGQGPEGSQEDEPAH